MEAKIKKTPFSIWRNTMIYILIQMYQVNGNNLRSQWDGSLEKMRSSVGEDPGGSVIGFAIGPILFFMSFALIWLNEKRAALDYVRLKLINEILEKQQHEMNEQASLGDKFVNKNPKLVYRTGSTTIVEPAYDEISDFHPPGAVKLSRKVEVKQYRSHQKSSDEVMVDLAWVTSNQPACQGKENPSSRWRFKSEVFYNGVAELDGIRLSESLKEVLTYNKTGMPTMQLAEAISKFGDFQADLCQPIILQPYIYFPGIEGDIQSHGTLRLKYQYTVLEKASVIACHDTENNEFQPFRIDQYHNKDGQQDTISCERTPAICCLCIGAGKLMRPIKEVNLIRDREISREELVKEEIRRNLFITNVIRAVTFVVMVAGIYLFFSPIVDLLGYIPIVGGFLSGTVGSIVLLGAFIVSVPLFLITFSLAWLRYHPKVGLMLLLVVAAIVAGIIVLDSTVGK